MSDTKPGLKVVNAEAWTHCGLPQGGEQECHCWEVQSVSLEAW